MDRDQRVDLYEAGVAAVDEVASSISDDGWARPACGEWSSRDTARHLLTVVGWYHAWLDRALIGETTPPFDASEMAAETAASLASAPDVDGAEAVRRFVAEAKRYLGRAADEWDRPFGYPYGTVTVGLHAGVAAVEWNIHAWDLSTVTGARWEPANADRLFVAAGECVAASQGGVRGAITRAVVPLAARRNPWPSLLRRSGRRP